MKNLIINSLVCLGSLHLQNLQGFQDLADSYNIELIDDEGQLIDPWTINIEAGSMDDADALYFRFDVEMNQLEVLPIAGMEEMGVECLFGLNIYKLVESLGKKIFGRDFLNMAGFYYDEPPEIGIFGHGELHEKIRITLINGILNVREDAMATAKLFSQSHGGINIHFIFRPSLGWAWDILKSTLIKGGYISQQAQDVALAWRMMIREMGGVGGGGKIIHYAHSIGAADTLAAKQLMKPEELAMISVVTFGSPIVFPKGGFASVVNYASVRDFVPFLRKLRIFIEEDNNIIFLGSHFGVPFIDHLLDNTTYRTAIERLGQEFIESYVFCEDI